MDAALINTGTAVHNSGKITAFLKKASDLGLFCGRDLGIRDDERRQEGMRSATFTADDAHDTHADWACRRFEGAVVVSMNGKTSRMTAGACELVELETGGIGVVNFLDFFRHRVEIWQKKSYHNLTGRHQPLKCVGRDQTLQGWGSCFFICYQNMITPMSRE